MSITPSPDPLQAPSLTPEYIIASVVNVLGLFATQGWITNETAKAITGIASVVVPWLFVAVQAYVKSRAHAAKVAYHATLPKGI